MIDYERFSRLCLFWCLFKSVLIILTVPLGWVIPEHISIVRNFLIGGIFADALILAIFIYKLKRDLK